MDLFVILSTAFNAVAPVVALLVLGNVLTRRGFFKPEFLRIGNRLVFSLCLPCMIFINIYDLPDLSGINFSLLGYCLIMTVALFFLGGLFARLVSRDSRRRGSLWQSTFRCNSAVLGMAFATALGGEAAVATTAVVSGFSVPLLNVLGILSLSLCAPREPGKGGPGPMVRSILRNPLIIGTLAGLACQLLRLLQLQLFGRVVLSLQADVKFLYTAVSWLKGVTTPLALLVMGGQFRFSAVRELLREILAGTAFRTVGVPILGIGLAAILSAVGLMSCGVDEYPALIAMFGSPVAVSSAVLAGNLGCDEQLATQLVVWTSVVSMATVFLQVCILMSFGLLAV